MEVEGRWTMKAVWKQSGQDRAIESFRDPVLP